MAEQDPDMRSPEHDRIDNLYRELPREEPPARIDAAIRAEAESAVATHPAPLVPPTGRRTWYFPAAAAAVIVLAVAVTWNVEREEEDPGATAPVPAAPASKVETAPKEEVPAPARRDEARGKIKAQKRDEPQFADNLAKQPAPAAQEPKAQRGLGGLSASVESPERWLERIAELRKAGRHDEADRELAEFRKRYPDFKIAPEMLEKVERR